MTPPPICVLYTQDSDLARRLSAYLSANAQVRQVTQPDRLEPVLEQTGPALLLIDLRARESRDFIAQIQQDSPHVLIIALGTARSDPLREAGQMGIYAAEDLELERRPFQAIAARAFDYLNVLQENRDLREKSTMASVTRSARAGEIVPQHSDAAAIPLLRFPRVFRRFDNVDALLANVVESFADAAGVTRVGIFSKSARGNHYKLRAGLRCLPETHELEFAERDPLVRWFERHAHLISRSNALQSPDQRQRAVMRQALDSFAAEVIVPLYAGNRIIGWMFFGNRFTGHSFDERDLEVLMMLAEHVSTVLENALLSEESSFQKNLAENVLKAIPSGIVATNDEGNIQWINSAAERILGAASENLINNPVEAVSSKLAGLVRATLESKGDLPSETWTDNLTQRSVSAETRWLGRNGAALGAVVILNDKTDEHTSREKQTLVDRAVFWSDLAASMSHEIRNPLVAIKTFTQLLPERFDDPDFRQDFNQIVVREINRLDKMIEQIDNFAHPPELVFKPLDVTASVQKAIELAQQRAPINGVSLETAMPGDLPKVLGDETALTEAFAHLVANATEALSGQKKARITLSAKRIREGDRATGVVVTVRDNGKGIAPDLKDKIFSPFYTTKPRGIGLGLPIVKRTVFDHNGRVEIESTPRGTLVNVVLPASSNGH